MVRQDSCCKEIDTAMRYFVNAKSFILFEGKEYMLVLCLSQTKKIRELLEVKLCEVSGSFFKIVKVTIILVISARPSVRPSVRPSILVELGCQWMD
jgi:hypothetical protein